MAVVFPPAWAFTTAPGLGGSCQSLGQHAAGQHACVPWSFIQRKINLNAMKHAASEFLKGSWLAEHEASCQQGAWPPGCSSRCGGTGSTVSSRPWQAEPHVAGAAERAAKTPPGP